MAARTAPTSSPFGVRLLAGIDAVLAASASVDAWRQLTVSYQGRSAVDWLFVAIVVLETFVLIGAAASLLTLWPRGWRLAVAAQFAAFLILGAQSIALTLHAYYTPNDSGTSSFEALAGFAALFPSAIAFAGAMYLLDRQRVRFPTAAVAISAAAVAAVILLTSTLAQTPRYQGYFLNGNARSAEQHMADLNAHARRPAQSVAVRH